MTFLLNEVPTRMCKIWMLFLCCEKLTFSVDNHSFSIQSTCSVDFKSKGYTTPTNIVPPQQIGPSVFQERPVSSKQARSDTMTSSTPSRDWSVGPLHVQQDDDNDAPLPENDEVKEYDRHAGLSRVVGEEIGFQVDDGTTSDDPNETSAPGMTAKEKRKASKKAAKAARRAQREGRGDPTAGNKPCHLCDKSVDLLIRCQVDASLEWKMVCKCWHSVSGGVVDGDAAHPYYRYGGLWKNRRRR